jgi:hypothetical protein
MTISTIGMAFPKPSAMKEEIPAVIVYPDGREVCTNTPKGQTEYRSRRSRMYRRDKGICVHCKLKIIPACAATWEHLKGRGMGGAKRDDRIEFGAVAHALCNQLAGSPNSKLTRNSQGDTI